ncbi:unnamed protein product, partial [Closterium sp. NIES-53]
TELVDFAAHSRLDYAASLVAESASVCPPSVGGECALSTDVLEDRQEKFQCFAAALPHLVSTLLAPEGDPDALDIPTPRSYAEAIEGPYSSQWQAAMDAEMASWESTGTYVDEVPPPGVNIVSGMWIFRVKRPPGSPPVFKARYVARGFSQRQGGSLHEEIWLRRPPGFTGSFPPGNQWSLRRPVYGFRQAPRQWHNTMRTTLAALGFAPSTADPLLFLRTDTLLPPFFILVYVDDLVFATANTAGLAHVLQRFDFTYSSPQATPLSTRHSLSALPSDESHTVMATGRAAQRVAVAVAAEARRWCSSRGRVWGWRVCEPSPPPPPPPPPSPTAAAAAEGGGWGRLSGGSRRVASSASSPEATISATVHTTPVAGVSAASAVASYLLSSHSPASSSLALCVGL